MRRAASYARVSSVMQLESHSLEAQHEACRRLASARGWELVATYTDEGESAGTTDRPAFQTMLAAAALGEFDIIIVHKLDRFSRSVTDLLLTLRQLEEIGVSVISATEQFDFTTPIGRVLLTLLAAFAEWYLANLSAETAKGKRARAEAGFWNGRLPYGYTTTYRKDGGDGRARVDEVAAEGVRLAFRLYARGDHSYLDVARALNEAGYRPTSRGGRRSMPVWSKDSIYSLLRNRFYLGEVTYKGKQYEGLHEPIVSRELFEAAREAGQRRYGRQRASVSAPKTSYPYPLRGVARCARCGHPMRGFSSATSGGRAYRDPGYERGTGCTMRTIRVTKVNEAMSRLLNGLVLPEDWREQVIAASRREVTPDDKDEDLNVTRARLERQLAAIQLQHRLGDVLDETYLEERERLSTALAALAPEREPVVPPDVEAAAEVLGSIGAVWDAATDEEREPIVRALFQEIYLDKTDRGEAIIVRVVPHQSVAVLFRLAGLKH